MEQQVDELNATVSKLRLDFVKDNTDLLIEMVDNMDIPVERKEAAKLKFKTLTPAELEELA